MTPDAAEAREWHRIVRASVRECLETWALQAETGSVSVEVLETILARATVPILRQFLRPQSQYELGSAVREAAPHGKF